MISHGVKSVISLYVVDNLLAVVNDRAFDGADAHPMGRISGDLLLDGDVEYDTPVFQTDGVRFSSKEEQAMRA